MPAFKPVPGLYRCTTDPQPGFPSTTVTYQVTEAGIPTTFGMLTWVNDASGGRFQSESGNIAIRFFDDHHFVAYDGPTGHSGTWVRL